MSTNKTDKDCGAAAVEFALILVLLLTLLFGIVEFGLGYFRWQGIQAAAREGARVAVVTPEVNRVATAEARARDALRGVVPDPENADIFPVDLCDDTDRMEVTVGYDHPIILPFLPAGPIRLEAVAEFRCERPD